MRTPLLTILTIGMLAATVDLAVAQEGGACCHYENVDGVAQLISPNGCVVRTGPECAAQPINDPDVDATLWYGPGTVCPPPDGEPGDACANNFSLPVELTSFEAVSQGKGEVVLLWETASEINNAGFHVEHEVGSDEFAEIGFVEGHGTTSDVKNYEFRVSGLDAGRHVFRLKQVDYDGAFEYSEAVEAAVELPDTYVLEPAYPNPFNPSTTIRFGTAVETEVSVELYDAAGKLVQTVYEGTPETGSMHSLTIDGSDLTSGTYLVKLSSADFQTSQPIVLLK